MSQSKLTRAVKSRAKKAAKKAWATQRKNAAKRREEYRKQRQEIRKIDREVREKVSRPRSAEAFWATNPALSGARHWVTLKGHEHLDRRDLKRGRITEDERNLQSKYANQYDWRREVLKLRKEGYAQWRSENAHGPLVFVEGKRPPVVVESPSFRVPAARVVSEKTVDAKWNGPSERKIHPKRSVSIEAIAASWAPILTMNARKAMASDGELSGAVRALREFGDQYPETRTQVHDHLGKLEVFGEAVAEVAEHMMSVLARGVGDDNPGLPPEVLRHLQSWVEAGELMRKGAHETLAAYEDYFQPAIKAAQDEYTPSKEALRG